ncbi:hypothetical protein [Emticicia sp. W12TSBA100-4]|uniref:hypothetical protein n=1 Tax=Emticicia sp. W12TSBA100-4 TaxID=3160965 RepID=UPI003305DAA2
MVTASHAEMQFALQNMAKQQPTMLNLTGGLSGSLTHIGYGHGHFGHFLFTDSTTGKKYAAAAHDDGNIYVKTSGWASNVPNYAISPSQLSDDLVDANLGTINALFPAIANELRFRKDTPFAAVENGTTVSVGGAIIQNSTGGNAISTLVNGNTVSPNSKTEPKKWVMPAIIGGVILVLGGLAYWAFKGK